MDHSFKSRVYSLDNLLPGAPEKTVERTWQFGLPGSLPMAQVG